VQTLKASKALLAHVKKAAKEKAEASAKKNILDDTDGQYDAEETPIWLTLTTKRHIADKARLQPGKIPLPHPLYAAAAADADAEGPKTSVCLITADPQRAYKDIVADEEFPALRGARIERVVGFEKLKSKFSQYEAQRKLFAEHDVFLADDRIINRLPKVLGKTFYKTTQKRPVPVVLAAKAPKIDGKKAKRVTKDGEPAPNAKAPADMAREIEKALGSALVSLSPTTNTAVRIGYARMTPEQIADNVDAVVTSLVEKWVPQKWRNVRGIYIKAPESVALPIWLTDELWLEDKDVITEEAAAAKALKASEKANVGKKRKSIEEAKGEKVTAEEAAEEAAAPKKKKAKKAQQPEADDSKLDKQISDRKSRLRKQKTAARKAMDD
jgi:ribosome biogenesis protein UTP30